MNTERQADETYLSYLKRIVEMTKQKIISYSEMGDLLLGEENCYSSDNLRKGFYILDKISNKLDDDIVVTDDSLIKEIEFQKDELFKETVRLRDKKREINNDLRKMARLENIENVLIEELKKIKTNQKIDIDKNVDYVSNEGTEAILLLSDIHYGIEVDNAFNKYNKEICKNRIYTIIKKALRYCELHNVQTLNVEILGDLINGIIHVSNRVEQEEDIIQQIIEISKILFDAIIYLNSKVPKVKVITVFGNHARVSANKKEQINKENFERLIYHYLKTMLPEDVSVINGDTDDFVLYEVCGKKIVVSHGDKDSGNNALNNFVRLLGIVPDEIHLGHYHHPKIQDDNDTEIVINGSLVSTDDYAVSLRKSTKPSQTLRIYSNNSNDICTLKLMACD